MDFSTLLKDLILIAIAVAIPVSAYAAVVATRAIWIKGEPGPVGPADDRLAELEARVAELEQGQRHVAELDERLDFAERLLARPRDPAQIERS